MMDDFFVFFLIGVCVGILFTLVLVDKWFRDIEQQTDTPPI